MSTFRRNLVANYLGQGWTAIMGMAFIPLYIRYLGMEAFGLVGFFSVLLTWLTLLDAGLTPTLKREMARFGSGEHTAQSIHDLLRSIELYTLTIAIAIVSAVWGLSGAIAARWLNLAELSPDVVARAIGIMALVVSLRFVETIYRGAILGLQDQVRYNIIYASVATLRNAGALAVLAFVSPTISAFFAWQAIVSVLSVALYSLTLKRSLPRPPARPRFNLDAVKEVWDFARGMFGITLLALLLTQVDKLLLSRLLPLSTFGYYMLAATIAGGLTTIINPVCQAIFPRFVQLASAGEEARLVSEYHAGAQLVTVLTAPVALLLMVFPEGILTLWTNDAIVARETAPLLAALALAIFLNGLMWIPHQLQLAHGWTSLALRINAIAVAVLVPAIFLVVPTHGAPGAAALRIALGAGYVLSIAHFMHARLLTGEKWNWYFTDVAVPTAGCAAILGLFWAIEPSASASPWLRLAFYAAAGGAALIVVTLLAPRVRARLLTRAKPSPAGAGRT